jgi:hypothetical protein
MILPSSLLLFAGNLQTLPAMACSNDSLLLTLKLLPAYVRQVGADIERVLPKVLLLSRPLYPRSPMKLSKSTP